MKKIEDLVLNPLNYVMGLADYQVIKRHFKGKLIRKIFVLVHDLSKKQSFRGQIYLTNGNVLLYISNVSGLSKVGLGTAELFELEEIDSVLIKDEADFDIQSLYNSAEYSEKTKSISTTGLISYLCINDRYVLLHSIAPDSGYSWKAATLFITGDDYTKKTENIRTTIKQIVNHDKVDETLPLPGISPFANTLINFSYIIFLALGIIFIFYKLL